MAMYRYDLEIAVARYAGIEIKNLAHATKEKKQLHELLAKELVCLVYLCCNRLWSF